MSKQRYLSAQYISAWAVLSRDAQAVLLALMLLADDSGVGVADPTIIHYQSPQLASTIDVCDVAVAMDELLDKWPPYGEYTVNGRHYYYLADGELSKWLPSNHRTKSQLPPPPDALVEEKKRAMAPMAALPVRGRPRGSISAKPSKKSKKAADTKDVWTDPRCPESVYQNWLSIYNAVVGPVLGEEKYITRNARRNIDKCIEDGIDEQDFQRACAVAAQSKWWRGETGEKKSQAISKLHAPQRWPETSLLAAVAAGV